MSVKFSSVPAVPGSGEAVLVTCRSAERLTVVLLVELLLPLAGSAVASALRVAVLVRVPPSVKLGAMWTTIEIGRASCRERWGAGRATVVWNESKAEAGDVESEVGQDGNGA